jgi:lysine-N-methylase
VELGLGLCCEAAAELILGQTELFSIVPLPSAMAERERTARADAEEADPLTIVLRNAREALFDVLQDRRIPLSHRIRHVLTSLDIHLPVSNYGEWSEFLLDLERLDPAWDGYLQRMGTLEQDPAEELDGEDSTAYEQLLVYFLYRYLTAEDDGRRDLLQVRVAFAILSVILIHGLTRAAGGEGSETLCEVARMYSSEIEYSEENLERFLDRIEDTLCEF